MKILQAADIVIDAFGTAKSLNNNTSSRFGKFLEVYYENSKEIKGAKIKTYLLQKGRVT
jgi:myosin heavy subunit